MTPEQIEAQGRVIRTLEAELAELDAEQRALYDASLASGSTTSQEFMRWCNRGEQINAQEWKIKAQITSIFEGFSDADGTAVAKAARHTTEAE